MQSDGSRMSSLVGGLQLTNCVLLDGITHQLQLTQSETNLYRCNCTSVTCYNAWEANKVLQSILEHVFLVVQK